MNDTTVYCSTVPPHSTQPQVTSDSDRHWWAGQTQSTGGVKSSSDGEPAVFVGQTAMAFQRAWGRPSQIDLSVMFALTQINWMSVKEKVK